jgi:predicted Rossmann fold nucleotide-binding protein DprA/Smf involved in DNA uptake
MKNLASDLKSVNKEINALSKKLDQLSKKADTLMKAMTQKKEKAAPTPKKKAAAKKPATSAAAAEKKPVKKKASKPAATPTSKVLAVMKRYKKGITIVKLKEKSGLSDKQISNILHRANKEGKIKRVSRGVYQLV